MKIRFFLLVLVLFVASMSVHTMEQESSSKKTESEKSPEQLLQEDAHRYPLLYANSELLKHKLVQAGKMRTTDPSVVRALQAILFDAEDIQRLKDAYTITDESEIPAYIQKLVNYLEQGLKNSSTASNVSQGDVLYVLKAYDYLTLSNKPLYRVLIARIADGITLNTLKRIAEQYSTGKKVPEGSIPAILNMLTDQDIAAVFGKLPYQYVYDILSSTVYLPFTLQKKLDNKASVRTIAVSPNGSYIAAASGNTIKIWDVVSDSEQTLQGYEYPIAAITYSPDNEKIAFVDVNNTIKIFDVLRHRELKTFDKYAYDYDYTTTALSYSPDGQYLASGLASRTELIPAGNMPLTFLKIWDARKGTIRNAFKFLPMVFSLCYSPNGEKIALGCKNQILIRKPLGTTDDMSSAFYDHSIEGNIGIINSIVYSPNGKFLAAGSDNGKIYMYDMQIEKMLYEWDGQAKAVTAVRYSPADNYVAASYYGGVLHIWDIKRNRIVQTLIGQQDKYFTSLCYSPDGTYLAAGSTDNNIWIWKREKDLSLKELFVRLYKQKEEQKEQQRARE